jgi:hypothetical protein
MWRRRSDDSNPSRRRAAIAKACALALVYALPLSLPTSDAHAQQGGGAGNRLPGQGGPNDPFGSGNNGDPPKQQDAPPETPASPKDPCAETVAGVPGGTREEQIAALRARLAESADLGKIKRFGNPQEAEAAQRCFATRLERLRGSLPRSQQLVALADDVATFEHNWGGKIDDFLDAKPVAAISGADWWKAADEAFATLAELAVRVPRALEPLEDARKRQIVPLEAELAAFTKEIATLKENLPGITTREDREKWLWILSWRANNAAREFDTLELDDLRRARPGGNSADPRSIEAARAALAEFASDLDKYVARRDELARNRPRGVTDWVSSKDRVEVVRILYLVNFAARGRERTLRTQDAAERERRAATFRERAATISDRKEDLERRQALVREWEEAMRTLDADLAEQLAESEKIYIDLRRDVQAKGASLPGG